MTRTLAAGALTLSLLSVTGLLLQRAFPTNHSIERIAVRFDLGGEANVPTWFSSGELLLCAGVVALIARRKARDADPHTTGWRVLAVVFALLSLDEVAQFHEMTNRPLRALVAAFAVFPYPWVLLAIPAVVVFVLVNVRLLTDLRPPHRRAFIVAGLIYVGGSLGMELVENLYIWVRGGEDFFLALVLITVEESMEMLGAALLAGALLAMLHESLSSGEIVARVD